MTSSQENRNIAKAVLKNSNASQRFNITVDQGNMKGGYKVMSYLNKYGMGGAQDIVVELHPNMIPGTILFDTDELPYPLSNVTNIKQVRYRRDYYQLEWPLRTRKYEYGVYADEVLQHYFPPSLGVLTNLADGIA